MSFVLASSSERVKPPLLDKNDAIKLWFACRKLELTTTAAINRKETYKSVAASTARRCTELETRLSELERRVADAEARVQHLKNELEKCESRAVARAQVQGRAAPRLLRHKLLGLVRRFHPDRTARTTPDEVTKALNGLLEAVDAVFSMSST